MLKVLLFKNAHEKGGRKMGWRRRRDEQIKQFIEGQGIAGSM